MVAAHEHIWPQTLVVPWLINLLSAGYVIRDMKMITLRPTVYVLAVSNPIIDTREVECVPTKLTIELSSYVKLNR